jgi:hypothetical protein
MAGLFVPLFLQTTSLLSGGGPVPMELIFDDAILAALFGAVAAGGSLRLAQRTEPMLPETVRPGLVGSGDPLGGTRWRNAAAGQRVG